MLRSTKAVLIALILTSCETTNSGSWTGGASTPFNQAERSCLGIAADIAEEANRREMFIGCMAALGWTPKPGASIEL